MELYDAECVRAIVSSFGNFLDIDDRTKELSALQFARACVEIDVTKPIPAKVWINLPNDKGFYQDVIVEGSISYCSKCKLHGHNLSTCRKLAKNRKTEETGKASDHSSGETNTLVGAPAEEGEWIKPKKGRKTSRKEATMKEKVSATVPETWEVTKTDDKDPTTPGTGDVLKAANEDPITPVTTEIVTKDSEGHTKDNNSDTTIISRPQNTTGTEEKRHDSIETDSEIAASKAWEEKLKRGRDSFSKKGVTQILQKRGVNIEGNHETVTAQPVVGLHEAILPQQSHQ